MKDVVIVSACRTPIGAFGGSLKDMHAATLAGIVMQAAVTRAGIDAIEIDDIRFGCCIEPADALNVARVGALFPWPVPSNGWMNRGHSRQTRRATYI